MAFVPLTQTRILACDTHDALFDLLSQELQRRLPHGIDADLDSHLKRLRAIPVGLRAMAVVHPLDVSLALDDLGWHFGNWPSHDYSKETIWALRELEAFEQADLFEKAYTLAQPYWQTICTVPDGEFSDWYNDFRIRESDRSADAALLATSEDRQRSVRLLDPLCAKISAQGCGHVRHRAKLHLTFPGLCVGIRVLMGARHRPCCCDGAGCARSLSPQGRGDWPLDATRGCGAPQGATDW